MSEEPVKKYLSGSEKRKKRLEQQNKHDELLKKTQNLFQLGFSRQSTENQPSPSTSAVSASQNTSLVVEPMEIPCECSEQNNQDQETATFAGAEERETEAEVQLLHQNVVHLGVECQNDIGLWQNITSEIQDYWCTRNPDECLHFESDFSASSRQYDDSNRFFSQSMFFRTHISGGKIKREWLMYSPSTGKVYCFPCVLFGGVQRQSQFQTGFSDWKNASPRIQSHENSATHRECVQTLISRRRVQGRIDTSLEITFNKEREYWIKVLQRVVSVIKFLASRGLAFRGDDEVIGSQNNGNYLGILELIAEYDPFLSSHLAKHVNVGKGKQSYLFSTICEELIEILGSKVLKFIVNEIFEAKYFSISVDSTPDISHIDQLTIVLRYVSSNGEVAKRFLTFIPIVSHKGEEIAAKIKNFFKQYNIDIKNARGQSYDNASNMSGCYNILQAHIKKINRLAHYVPCAAHSLNLVGVRAAESRVGAISFFGFVQGLYNFFSASTHRWRIMLENLEKEDECKKYSSLVLKNVSDTRWCARDDAAKALSKGYKSFQKALQSIANDETQTSQVTHEARCLLKESEKKENAVMTIFWAAILDQINGVSISLQKPTIELRTAVDLLKSLLDFLLLQRELFDDYEIKANEKTDTEYTVLHAVVAKFEQQLEQEGYAVGTFLDIEGAIGNTPEFICQEA
ncbi:zinc finger MYM-type protein 1-like [Belonocnema kinseyi]|uniref:zinc finger MYM-type protein 1-like n=1 Tax=Belonocnema kinseyi TaxID=2817044 RepID=UPI00143CDE67|nr:zinc finger MYM-type protein 1-like [Belonocnema kinseyi]